jgi:hypothetical protein
MTEVNSNRRGDKRDEDEGFMGRMPVRDQGMTQLDSMLSGRASSPVKRTMYAPLLAWRWN